MSVFDGCRNNFEIVLVLFILLVIVVCWCNN
ncbi:sporulation protein YjcZ [Brevibacillus laterosporus]|uniref:Sporulation protein YjcZ n=1 Tax=Brevibacillus laterosporus TaxID=1465 RepID=A0A502HBK5_BRELA|nr:sporulation protein YjcZ [Brevibacillus laterosporus]QDX92301.1 sporulation protein YjcZ [Brevibacillus laterosporus]TPG70610.1 sporulation protein YjcZ [Brevibacillus laterosporus]TPG80245.1 sporulation protein YjcZ [Brevibacillus laterosporus]